MRWAGRAVEYFRGDRPQKTMASPTLGACFRLCRGRCLRSCAGSARRGWRGPHADQLHRVRLHWRPRGSHRFASKSTTPTGPPRRTWAPARTATTGAHRQRFHEGGRDDGPWPLYWRTEKAKAKAEGRGQPIKTCAPANCGTRSPTRRGRAPTPASSSTRRSTNGTPARPTGGSMRRTRAASRATRLSPLQTAAMRSPSVNSAARRSMFTPGTIRRETVVAPMYNIGVSARGRGCSG